MYRFDDSQDSVDRSALNDPRLRAQSDSEVVVDRKAIVVDRPHHGSDWPPVPDDRRRGERRRIERMGTDI